MTENFLDLFPKRSTMVFVDEPDRVLAHAGAIETEFRESMTSRAEKGYILPGQMSLLTGKEEVAAKMCAFRRVGLAGLMGVGIGRVSVKGKTNERMDDVGAGKGIVVHAVALLCESKAE